MKKRKRMLRESNTIETAYPSLFTPSKERISEHPRQEHCSASRNQLHRMGLNPGQQVRIERPTANGTRVALYTIDAHDDEEPDNAVFVGYTDPNLEDLQKRLGWSSKDSFMGDINTQVTAIGLTDDDAKAYSEFIEQLNDDGYNQALAVIAPHGGDIEEGTAEEGDRIAEQLSPKCVSVWICKGYNKEEDGGAYARWHITSTDISGNSFPGLQAIINRQFKYVIAFHGWKHDNSICIGGSMPYRLKQKIKTEIVKVVPSKIEVEIAGPGSNCPGDFNGNEPENIVNRLGTYGVQIEQSKEARKSYGIAIADAVANVFRPLINAGGFFRPNHFIITEQDLRDVIGTGAQAERDDWLDTTGNNLLGEDENSQFGLLVKYWLASKSRIRPTTLTAAQINAVSSATNYGQLLNDYATDAEVSAEAATVRGILLSGAPDTASPLDLHTLVEQSLITARFSRLDDDNRGRWSAAFVVSVVRNAAIQLGLEAMSGSTHVGRDELLVGTSAHRVYVLEAYNRRFGTNPRSGTYHAFRPDERTPQIGDIIIQDRRADNINNVVRFDDIPTALNSEYNLHGDIVVEVPNGADYVIAIGGNVGDSARRRRYPLDSNRHLVVDRTQLYTQESDSGNLPTLPDMDDSPGLQVRSTGRIFALLSLVKQCAAIPGQKVSEGVLF